VSGDPVVPGPLAVEEAAQQMRAPGAAGIAGLLFAGLFSGALVLIRNQPYLSADDATIARAFAAGDDLAGVIGGLYLAPFAGIMFLWFIAVIRDQIGEREDRFFATVFFGSGLLFVAVLYAAMAVASAPLVGYRYLGQAPPSAAEIQTARELSYTLLFAFGMRAAAVFLFAMATVGMRSGVFSRRVAWVGYLVGAVLLVVVALWDWVVLIFPAWIALISLYILRRERARRRMP
jgi:hypothetical protein